MILNLFDTIVNTASIFVNHYNLEITQRLNGSIAMYVAAEEPLIIEGQYNEKALKKLAQKNAGFQVIITDTGRGISEHQLPHIFDRLYQAENSSQDSRSSSGLGLAIVKVTAHAYRHCREGGNLLNNAEKHRVNQLWIPAFAGMTGVGSN